MSRILRSRGSLAVLSAACLLPALLAVDGSSAEDAAPACRPASVPPDPARPVLDCPAPPNTFDVTAFLSAGASAEMKRQAGPTYDSWAWATFAAMNWPARPETDPRAYPTGHQRGVPDTSGAPGTTFADAPHDAVLVWETFKEKRELFHPTAEDGGVVPVLPPGAPWQDVTFDASQQPRPSIPGAPGIDPCTDEDAARRAELGDGHHRFLSQGIKVPSGEDDQTFDETIQVASPAREAAAALCAGYTDPAGPPPPSDPDSQPPSYTDCVNNLFPDDHVDQRSPVGPRIWKGNPKESTARPIFFEVKVNYDFWKYILDNGFNDDAKAAAAASSGERGLHPKLPFRTSAASGPGRSPDSTFGYDASRVAAAYADLPDPGALPGIGSVQLKAAWLLLDPAKYPGDDPRRYHTTEAVFYQTKPDAPPDFPDSKALEYTCYRVETFGLLGLHIIQRVHAQPFSRANPELFGRGGTFVFSTWEHRDLGEYQQPTDFYYANYFAFQAPPPVFQKFPFDVQTTPFPDYTRAAGGALNVVRRMPYPLASTAAVNKAVRDRLPGSSIWRNYRLIGTQFMAIDETVDGVSTEATYNQPFYLANLVVETNEGLQEFIGLPPAVSITQYYTDKVGIQESGPAFARDMPNVIFNRELRQPANMGGCMGCHGVAQLKGFNFSFVFAGGQKGAGLDTQHHFAVAGAVTN